MVTIAPVRPSQFSSTLAQRIARIDRTHIAAIEEGSSITYGELVDQARAIADELDLDRGLAVLESEVSIRWLVAYIALQMKGYAVLLAPKDSKTTIETLIRQYKANVEISRETNYTPTVRKPLPSRLHPELSVLLLTSGSTGSPKCVKLSRENIASNARAIVEYLEIGPDERGVVNLPVHYSYGMSIVNSHLWAGATLVLTELSVVDPAFWRFCTEQGATSFAGVPHTYDLLSRIDFPALAPPSLRYFTQAGGRLAPERAVELGKAAAENGWRFYVMYGQTEASPRMAYMPPDALAKNPGSIGIAIPGGSLWVEDENGDRLPPGCEGELVYNGPNVMMGYASSIDELDAPPGACVLRTGDLAKISEDGFFYITGRMSRFVKIFGVRIGLDEVERACATAGYTVIATGTDEKLLVITREQNHTQDIAAFLARRLNLPEMSIEVRGVSEFPVLPTGKIDYAGLKASISAPKKRGARNARAVSDIYQDVFGPSAADQSLSFKDLHGDSLTFVRVSLELEEVFGPLPDDWSELSIEALQSRLTSNDDQHSEAAPAKHSVLHNTDTLRSIACLLVVAAHVFGLNVYTGLHLPNDTLARLPIDLFELIRMPLFTALAGVLYAAIPSSRSGFGDFVRNRAFSFLVPMLLVGSIYFVIRDTMGMTGPPLIPTVFTGYLHLWYLFALFAMAIAVAALDLFVRPNKTVWLGVIILLYLAPMVVPWTVLTPAIKLAPYYILGMLFYRYPETFNAKGLMPIALVIGACGALFQGGDFLNLVDLPRWPARLFSIALVLAAMRYVPRIRSIEWIGIYSYAIYLWHPAANAAVRETLMNFGVDNLPLLFVLGMIAGVIAPILMFKAAWKAPNALRVMVLGR